MTPMELVEAAIRDARQDYAGYSQRFATDLWVLAHGRVPPVAYGTARQAFKSSEIESHRYKDAPAGAFHYFIGTRFGDVMFSLGEGLAAATNQTALRVGYLGRGVGIVNLAERRDMAQTYLGWSLTNGKRESIVPLFRRDGLTVSETSGSIQSDSMTDAPTEREVQ